MTATPGWHCRGVCWILTRNRGDRLLRSGNGGSGSDRGPVSRGLHEPDIDDLVMDACPVHDRADLVGDQVFGVLQGGGLGRFLEVQTVVLDLVRVAVFDSSAADISSALHPASYRAKGSRA